ncbi:MAG: hypothetical protein K2N18_04180 [Clostridia bacterium]|nr:hypothetical protein [Clostridia bacterium]
MDFILPNDDTMELMREEFAKMKANSFAHTYALANNDENKSDELSNSLNEDDCKNKTDELSNGLSDNDSKRKADEVRAYIGSPVAGLFLLLYFVKHLGYNISYGTQIFNTQRGMEQLRRNENHFGQLNNLG